MSSTSTTTVSTIDELRAFVGRELGVGPWTEITQGRVNAFADATGDHPWIHVDVERAKDSPFGGTIAHGYLTLSMTPFLQRDADGMVVDLPVKRAINYGLNRLRFPAPVRVGKRIRARTTLVGVEDVGGSAYQVTHQITVDIEGEPKPALVAEHIVRWYL